MNCPSCGQPTIGFWRWSFKFRYYWTCPHCEAKLRSGRSVIVWSMVMAMVGLIFVVVDFMVVDIDAPPFPFLKSQLIPFAILVLVLMLLGYISYRTGDYVILEDAQEEERLARRRRWPWVAAAVIGGPILLALIGWMVVYHKLEILKEANGCHSRGAANARAGRYEAAIADFTSAIRLNPKFAFAYGYRGYAFAIKGDLDQAIADLNEAIRLDPKYVNAYGNRARVYYEKGEVDQAIRDCTQAIRLSPYRAASYAQRAATYYETSDYDKAIADLNEAIRLRPEVAAYYAARGNAYFWKTDFEKAFADFDQAIRLEHKEEDSTSSARP